MCVYIYYIYTGYIDIYTGIQAVYIPVERPPSQVHVHVRYVTGLALDKSAHNKFILQGGGVNTSTAAEKGSCVQKLNKNKNAKKKNKNAKKKNKQFLKNKIRHLCYYCIYWLCYDYHQYEWVFKSPVKYAASLRLLFLLHFCLRLGLRLRLERTPHRPAGSPVDLTRAVFQQCFLVPVRVVQVALVRGEGIVLRPLAIEGL